MVTNTRIVPLNHWDSATLSTSAAPATGFPILNTQNSTRGLVCRTTSAAAQSWFGTWGASPIRTATHIGMFLHNVGGLGSTGTMRWQLFSDAAWTTQVYDSTALSANQITPTEVYDFGISTNDPFVGMRPFRLWFTERAFRSARVTFGGTPPDAYFQASHIFIGKAFEVFWDPAFGMTLGYADNSDRSRSRGGSLRTSVGASWRVGQMDLKRIPEAERATWLDIMHYCGTGRDFVLSIFPEDGTRKEWDHYGNFKFVGLDAIGRQATTLEKRVQIEEV